MTACEVAAHLMASCKLLKYFEAYMFGSTLHGIGQDIDILVVGPDGEILLKLKEEMRFAGENLPLHILYMLPTEERFTNFIAAEKCVPLAQLASPSKV